MTNYAKKHPYFLTAIIIALVAIILFLQGYRIQPNLHVSKNGTLEVTFPMASTTLFVDDVKIKTEGTEGEKISTSLSVSAHTVLVARLGYFPWMQKVNILPNTTTTIQPIFVTQNTTGQIITQKDVQYWKLRYEVEHAPLPTETSPRILGDVSIWVTGNTIYLKNGDTVKTILTTPDTIRSLDFYKDRTDVIVFAADTGVYAVDAVENPLKNKANFFPIYKGAKPIFEKTDNSFLYVVDGENLMMVVI